MSWQEKLQRRMEHPTKNWGSKKPEYLSHRQEALKARKRRIAAKSRKQNRPTKGQKAARKRNKKKARKQ